MIYDINGGKLDCEKGIWLNYDHCSMLVWL